MKVSSRLTLNYLHLQRACLLRLTRLAERLHPPPAKSVHLRTGERGEFEALFFLRQHGYAVVERRWRSPDLNGDLDLIGWDSDTLAIVEVKTRTARDLMPAASAIDEAKRNMLRRMARAYLRTLPRDGDDPILLRFDVVSVYFLGSRNDPRVECELLQDAFPLHPGRQESIHSRYGV